LFRSSGPGGRSDPVILEYSPLGLGKGVVDGIFALPKGGNAPVVLQRMAAEELEVARRGADLFYLGYWLAPAWTNDRRCAHHRVAGSTAMVQEGRRPTPEDRRTSGWEIGRLQPRRKPHRPRANFQRALGGEGVRSLAQPERIAELAFSGLRTVADQPFVTGASQAIPDGSTSEGSCHFARTPLALCAGRRGGGGRGTTFLRRDPNVDVVRGPLRGIAGGGGVA